MRGAWAIGEIGESVGSFELLDIYGGAGRLEYSEGCVDGKADECKIRIFVQVKAEGYDALLSSAKGSSFKYLNYMDFLEKTGQPLFIEFEEMLADSESEVAGYIVKYYTESKVRRFTIRYDSRDLPGVLKNNPLLLYSVMSVNQSRLDLMLCPELEKNPYITSLEWLGGRSMDISLAGRGDKYGYQYYRYPKDNELFLDLGGPFSINNISEGVGFRFVSNDRTQAPVRMVTGYHSERKDWLIGGMSKVAMHLALLVNLGFNVWRLRVAGILVSSLLWVVEYRTGELQALVRKSFPDEFQFNPRFQGSQLLNTLRASDDEMK